MKTSIRLMLASIFFLTFVVGCSGSSDDDPFIRILHAGPGVGPVNVEVNGLRLTSNLSYRQVVDYVQTDRDQVIIEVFDTQSAEKIYL